MHILFLNANANSPITSRSILGAIVAKVGGRLVIARTRSKAGAGCPVNKRKTVATPYLASISKLANRILPGMVDKRTGSLFLVTKRIHGRSLKRWFLVFRPASPRVTLLNLDMVYLQGDCF